MARAVDRDAKAPRSLSLSSKATARFLRHASLSLSLSGVAYAFALYVKNPLRALLRMILRRRRP